MFAKFAKVTPKFLLYIRDRITNNPALNILQRQRHVPTIRDQPLRDNNYQLSQSDLFGRILFCSLIGVLHSCRQTRAHTLARARSGQYLVTGRMRTRRESKVILPPTFPLFLLFLKGCVRPARYRCWYAQTPNPPGIKMERLVRRTTTLFVLTPCFSPPPPKKRPLPAMMGERDPKQTCPAVLGIAVHAGLTHRRKRGPPPGAQAERTWKYGWPCFPTCCSPAVVGLRRSVQTAAPA